MAADLSTDVRELREYPSDVQDVLSALSMTGTWRDGTLVVVGSSSQRRLAGTASDVDCAQEVAVEAATRAEAQEKAARMVQAAVRRLLATPHVCVSRDSKFGVAADLDVWPAGVHVAGKRVVGYDQKYTLARIDALQAGGAATADEAEAWRQAVEDAGARPTPRDWFALSGGIRPQVIRWSARQMLDGEAPRSDGRMVKLADALGQPAFGKLDVVAWLPSQGRFVDFSLLLQFLWRGEPLNNGAASQLPFVLSVQQDIARFWPHKAAKVIKRMATVARVEGRTATLRKLGAIVRSSVGAAYALDADLGTLESLTELCPRVNVAKLKLEMSAIRGRIAALWGLDRLDAAARTALDALLAQARLAHDDASGLALLRRVCAEAHDLLAPIVNQAAREALAEAGITRRGRLPRWALP